MKVLGIDTSGYTNAIGVVDNTKVLADSTFEARTDSLEKIITNIESTLHNAGITFKDIDGIGVGLGPGSWTGIRVGLTVAKILAYSANKPVRGLPTLDILAVQSPEKHRIVCPVIHTGARDNIYSALYRFENDHVSRTSEYFVGNVADLFSLINEPSLFIGKNLDSYSELSDKDIEIFEAEPRGSIVATLAAEYLEKGKMEDALSLTPLYLKESTARALQNRYSRNT